MRARARTTHVLLAVALTVPALAQSPLELTTAQPAPSSAPSTTPDQPKADKTKEALARRQAALALLDLVLSGARNLSLPQNRIQIASEALPLVWRSNEARARSLVTQMIGDFTQAATLPQESLTPNERNMLRQQWQVVVRIIAQSDAGLALSFMDATRSLVQIGNAEQQENEERGLRLELATQGAEHDPRNALRLAEKELQNPGDLDPQLINLLTQITAKDPSAGTELRREIISRVRSTDLSSGEENFGFALSLLNAEANSLANGAVPDEALQSLAEAVASAALNPEFPSENLPSLQGSLPALEQFAPARVQALRQKVEESTPTLNLQQGRSDEFTAALQNGDTNQGLVLAEEASPDARPNMYQQVAWQFASSGNLQQARQVADKLTDPVQGEQVLQQALRQSASNAANQGQFASARQIAQEITPEEDRAIVLAQLATTAADAKHEALALEILEEAAELLGNRPASSSVFSAQLQVAQAFTHIKPARAVSLMERSAGQIERVLAAAIEVDPFLPTSRSFEGGELILNNSFLCNTLIQPYAQAAAELANYDLPTARILANRLSLPEARLYAELFVARTALGEQNISLAPPSTNSLNFGFRIVE